MVALKAQFASTTETSPLDAVIVGAGPAGVVSLRNLLRHNLNVISIERQSAVGGLWVDHIPEYSSLQVLRPDWAVHGVSFRCDCTDDRRCRRDHVAQWVEHYADSQRIRNRIFLNTEVVQVTPIRPFLFLIEVSSVEKCGYLGGGQRVPESTFRIYTRSVLYCAGTFLYPYKANCRLRKPS